VTNTLPNIIHTHRFHNTVRKKGKSKQEKMKVIVFDWDDTLCPSSFVDKCKVENVKDLPLHYQNLLEDVGRCAQRCLETASKYGQVKSL